MPSSPLQQQLQLIMQNRVTMIVGGVPVLEDLLQVADIVNFLRCGCPAVQIRSTLEPRAIKSLKAELTALECGDSFQMEGGDNIPNDGFGHKGVITVTRTVSP